MNLGNAAIRSFAIRNFADIQSMLIVPGHAILLRQSMPGNCSYPLSIRIDWIDVTT